MLGQKVTAIVITYEPDPAILTELIKVLIGQVDSIVLVDNGSTIDVSLCIRPYSAHKASLLYLKKNMGLAFAQNRGIDVARKLKAAFILLMDQDSIPEPGMVQALVSAAIEKTAGAVGPRFLDPRLENSPLFIRTCGLKLVRQSCSTPAAVVPVDYLISSGCLIPMCVLDRVGGMREDFFIDFVDIEWGLRARRFGYQSYGVCNAEMSHCLGNKPIKLLHMKFPAHSSLRHYYHFRNAVLLTRERWTPGNWKLANSRQMCLKYIFYALFAKPRLEHLRMMTVGIWHGLIGRTGQYRKA